MIKNKCDHEWNKHTNSSRELGAGTISATFMCDKCHTELTASDVFQLEALENQNETLKHLKGFQKHIAIIAVVISFVALLISILSLLVPLFLK